MFRDLCHVDILCGQSRRALRGHPVPPSSLTAGALSCETKVGAPVVSCLIKISPPLPGSRKTGPGLVS